MPTFTRTLASDVWNKLTEKANSLSVPKNRLIENALRIYLDQLTRVEYVKSYKTVANDDDIVTMAEEGMVDYMKQLEE